MREEKKGGKGGLCHDQIFLVAAGEGAAAAITEKKERKRDREQMPRRRSKAARVQM